MIRSPLLVAASFASLVACSDHSASLATGPRGNTPIEPSIAELRGTVELWNDIDGNYVVHLRTNDDAHVLLVGLQARYIASVPGAEVIVRGTFDANPGLVVERFQVMSMNGRPALDGVLELTAAGYALQLFDGTAFLLQGAPEELAKYEGQRLWITGAEDPPIDFGVIEAR